MIRANMPARGPMGMEKWEMGASAMTSCVVLGLFLLDPRVGRHVTMCVKFPREFSLLRVVVGQFSRPGELGQPLSRPHKIFQFANRKTIGLERWHPWLHVTGSVWLPSSTCHIWHSAPFHSSNTSNQRARFPPHVSRANL
jgi:hypothetical protein